MILVTKHDVKAPVLDDRNVLRMMTSFGLEDPNKLEPFYNELAKNVKSVIYFIYGQLLLVEETDQ
jgi:hypothetical protein